MTLLSCGCTVKDIFVLSDPIEPRASSPSEYTAASQEKILQSGRALYSPIHSWQTRVIRLRPGAIDDPLVCDLVVADLITFNGVGLASEGRTVEYEALSYSWGYPSLTDRVLCNGVDHPITHNLGDALRHLRFNNSVRYLWVDAFCINQSDLVEKSRQVSIMLQIFRKAKDVIVWLGMPEGYEFKILGSLKLLSDHRASDLIISEKPGTMSNGQKMPQLLCSDHQQWLMDKIYRFLAKPWFSRTWVRQEVVAAANDIMMWCGPYKISFNALTKGVSTIRRQYNVPGLTLHSGSSDDVPWFDCFDLLANSIEFSQMPKTGAPQIPCPTFTWLDTMISGVKFNATDPRDRIFALIGMLPALVSESAPAARLGEAFKNPPPYPIDYTKQETEVYNDLVKYLVNSTQGLHALCIFQNRKNALPDLPTWAIDLRKKDPRMVPRNYAAYPMRKARPSIDFADSSIIETTTTDSFQVTGFVFGELTKSASMLTLRWGMTRTNSGRQFPVNKEFAFASTLTPRPMELVERYGYVPFRVQPRGSVDQLDLTIFVSNASQPGDIVVILEGGDCFPFVLRKVPERIDCYTFLGPAVFSSRNNSGQGYHYQAWSRELCFSIFHQITRHSACERTFILL